MNKILFVLTVFIIKLLQVAHAQTAEKPPVDLVYPLLDAAHSRWFYFSSACRPFGMVSLFPDNKTGGEWESGYRYDEDTIQCFSHIHEWQLSGVAVMPVTFSKQNMTTVLNSYGSPFSHKKETVKPGYHAVELDRYKINAEVTATNRVGFHRYRFPASKAAGVIFQLGGHLGPSDLLKGGFEQTGKYEINGFMVNGPTIRRSKESPVYFHAVFNHPIKRIILSESGKITEGVKRWSGENGKILVELETAAGKAILMKVGVSFADEKGAANNVEKELPGWDFTQVMKDASAQWNTMLSRIKIEGGTLQQQRRFYTDLWHAIQGRRIISDADGRYADCTGQKKIVKQLPVSRSGKPLFNMYNSDAFWGAQWTLNVLWQLVYPEVAEEFLNSFLEYYKNGGLIPRGPSGGNYTFVMTGASTTPFYVSALQKGIRGFDINLAYEGLKKNHHAGGLFSKAGYEHKTAKGGGVEYYESIGYVPYPLSDTIYGMHQDGAAQTLEYAYQDWCLAQLSKALKKEDDYNYYMKRSQNFRNLYNAKEGYIVPKDKAGNFKSPYDPLLYENGFEEANGTQFTWFVPHDMPALFNLMGGRDSATARLNRQFEQSRYHRFCNEHPERDDKGTLENPTYTSDKSAPLRKFINDKRTWINYSNQPNSQAAFIFNYTGAPWLTQYWGRTVIDSVFSKLSPHYGYNGDEDQGLMGSLSVLMKTGLFQMSGGCEDDPKYEIGSPLFNKITFNLDPKYFTSKELVIEAKNNSAANQYIQSATLNGKELKTFFFRQSDINKGSKIMLTMGDKPNKSWGIE